MKYKYSFEMKLVQFALVMANTAYMSFTFCFDHFSDQEAI